MDSNFLPKVRLSVTNAGLPTVNCLVRGKHVHCTAEERVRQRILKWLVNNKIWPIEQIAVEKSHKWYGTKDKTHIRSDIELLDEKFETQLVVECKAPHIFLSELDVQQAKDYAIKSNAKFVWITNGEDHIFQAKDGRNWKTVNSLNLLKVKIKGQPILPSFPENLTPHNVNKYLSKRGDAHDMDFSRHSKPIKDIVMAFNKLIFHTKIALPSSNSDFFILKDCGARYLTPSTPVGSWGGWYRGFIAGTIGRSESCWLTISFMDGYKNDDTKGLKVFVCFQTIGGLRQRLQLTMNDKYCVLNEPKKCWEIFHNGSMSKISVDKVMHAISEAGADHLINTDNKGSRVKLGSLQFAETYTRKNSKNFLSNLLQYGLIRNSLALSEYSRKRKKFS